MKFSGYRSVQGAIGLKNSFDWVERDDSNNKIYRPLLKNSAITQVQTWDYNDGYMGSSFALSPFAIFDSNGGMCFADMPYIVRKGYLIPVINGYARMLLGNYWDDHNTISDTFWREEKGSKHHMGWDFTEWYEVTKNTFGDNKHAVYSLITADTPIVTILSGDFFSNSLAMVSKPTGEITGSDHQISIGVGEGKLESQISVGYVYDLNQLTRFNSRWSDEQFFFASIVYRAFTNLALALHFPKELFDALLSVITDVEEEVPSEISLYILQAIYGGERLKQLLNCDPRKVLWSKEYFLTPDDPNYDLFNVWR